MFTWIHSGSLIFSFWGPLPVGGPLPSNWDRILWHCFYISVHSALMLFRFYCALNRFNVSCTKCSKVSPKTETPPCFAVGTVFFSLKASSILLWTNFSFCSICTKDRSQENYSSSTYILANSSHFFMFFSKVGSSQVFIYEVHFHSESNILYDCCNLHVGSQLLSVLRISSVLFSS